MLVVAAIFLICFVGGIFFIVKGAKKKRIMAIVFATLFIIVSAPVIVVIVSEFVPWPKNWRHSVHFLILPKDLFEPVVTDTFLFTENGFTKKYLIKPKYLDIYEIGLLSDKKDITSKYKFKGKIKAEFFWKDTLLFESLITSMDQAWYAGNDMEHYKMISLLKFDMPLQGKYKEDVSVKLTVLEPDQELKKYGASIKLYIGVSPSP